MFMTPWLWVVVLAFFVLVWTWLLYPLVIWLASRCVRVPARVEPTELPRVTAIVASRDDAATIAARVADFLRADYPADRLNIVVGLDSTGAPCLDEIRAGDTEPGVGEAEDAELQVELGMERLILEPQHIARGAATGGR